MMVSSVGDHGESIRAMWHLSHPRFPRSASRGSRCFLVVPSSAREARRHCVDYCSSIDGWSSEAGAKPTFSHMELRYVVDASNVPHTLRCHEHTSRVFLTWFLDGTFVSTLSMQVTRSASDRREREGTGPDDWRSPRLSTRDMRCVRT